MITNEHVQYPTPSYQPVAPAGYEASYPTTSAPDPYLVSHTSGEPHLHGDPTADHAATEAPKIEPEHPRDWRRQLELAIEALESELNSSLAGAPLGDTTEEGNDSSDTTRLSPSKKQELAGLDAQLRMLYLAGGMREAAVEPVEFYDASQREFWKYAMNGLSVYLDREKHPVDDRRLRLALRDLRQAVAELASDSSLDVRNLAFCSKVGSFGSYEEFPEYEFKAGEEVLLYVEVENFTSEKKGSGFETTLLGSYRVFDAQKNRVADHTFMEETETCRNQRRDYFITYRMWIPKDISPGEYTLQLTLEDMKGNKSGQASLRFKVKR